MKSKNTIILISILTIILYIILAFNSNNHVNAADKSAGTLDPAINDIDDAIYPGYKNLINTMTAGHSNYRFLVYYTGMDWNQVLTAEFQGHGYSPKNLFQLGSNYNGMWVCPICGNNHYDNGSWSCASLEALAYMMDPRNSINDSDIFQFKDLEGSDVSYEDIARIVAGYGEYINNAEVIQAIVDASNEYNINGYFLVAKIINEHGRNGSTLSNGNGYNGKYVGVYNYFNIGSTGNGADRIINNGLSYAQSHGWTSRRASIFGGAQVVKESFITRYSQNTLYYQKFNVSGKSEVASHQYQQNIMAAQSQGSSLKAYYGSNNSRIYTFIIPLYKNIPQTACLRPNATQANSITYEEGIVQNISSALKVRAGEGTSAIAIGKLNNNEEIKILRRATTQVNGYFWDLIVSKQDGTYGYAARNIAGTEHIVSKGAIGNSSGSVGTNNSQTPAQNSTPSSEGATLTNQNTNPNISNNSSISDSQIKLLGNFIEAMPEMKIEDLKLKYKDYTVIVKDGSGNDASTGNLGTGFKVTINDKTYSIVKKGDVNGDGTVSIIDAVAILNAVKGNKVLENEYKEAASVKNNDTFNVTDVVLLLNYIKGDASLSLK